MKTFSMKWRIILPIALVLSVGITAIVVIIAVNYSNTTTRITREQLEATSYRYANETKARLDASLGGVRSLAGMLEGAAGTPTADREAFNRMFRKVITDDNEMFGLFVCFEPNAFDGKDVEFVNVDPYGKTGRYIPFLYKAEGGVRLEKVSNYDVEGDGDFYLILKRTGQETVTSPYAFGIDGKSYIVASMVEPLTNDGRFIGVIGCDVIFDAIAKAVDSISFYESGYAYMVDHTGLVVAHRNRDILLKPSFDYIDEDFAAVMRQCLSSGQSQVVESTSKVTGVTGIFAVCPFPIGNTGKYWVMVLTAPMQEVMASVTKGVTLIIGVGALLLVVSLVILYLLVTGIIKALTAINEEITSASEAVARAASDIDEASSSLAEGSTEQAASLEEVSSSLEEMSSMTRQNADNANKTNETTQTTANAVGEGSGAVQDMSRAMSEIDDSADKIKNIIKAIEDIAFQTNLLALNAAVEAARAGEAGKGFAVVADEVRNLAQRSATSAGETTSLIGTTIERVHNGTAIAERLGVCFKEIEDGATSVGRLIDEITSATNEQAMGVDQINTAVAQLDKATQSSAANAETTARSARELNELSSNLNDMVVRLAGLIAGGGKSTVSSAARGKAKADYGRLALPPPRRHM